MGIIEAITAVAGAIKSAFGYAQQKDSENNTAPMVQAKEASAEAAANDQTRKALEKGDLDELRKEAAE